jgi:16S rRNA processing protein RimM
VSKDKLILVGVISSAHGINGDVIIKSFTKPSENIVKLPVQDESGSVLELKYVRSRKEGEIICHIKGYDTRSRAESLKKTAMYCKRSGLPQKAENEFYFEDLKGLIVKNESGEEIGVIINVLNYGAGDIIEIMFTDMKETELFPFNKEFFPVIQKDSITIKK